MVSCSLQYLDGYNLEASQTSVWRSYKPLPSLNDSTCVGTVLVPRGAAVRVEVRDLTIWALNPDDQRSGTPY